MARYVLRNDCYVPTPNGIIHFKAGRIVDEALLDFPLSNFTAAGASLVAEGDPSTDELAALVRKGNDRGRDPNIDPNAPVWPASGQGVPATRRVDTGDGLQGGGSLATDLTLSVLVGGDGSLAFDGGALVVGALADDAQHGFRGGGSLHTTATPLEEGFMSAADKDALDDLVAGGPYVGTARQVSAGQGLTGGGALSNDITLSASLSNDGSLVFASNQLQVGVLASDAQHGVRGGGTAHAAATQVSAGFLSAADKVALDALIAGGGGGGTLTGDANGPAGSNVVSSLTGTGGLVNVPSAALTFGSPSSVPGSPGRLRFASGLVMASFLNAGGTANVSLLASDGSDHVFVGDAANGGDLRLRSPSAVTAFVGSTQHSFDATGLALDAANAALTGTLRFPKLSSLRARNNAGSADLNLASTDASDILTFGDALNAGMRFNTGVGATLKAQVNSADALTVGASLVTVDAGALALSGGTVAATGRIRAPTTTNIVVARNAGGTADVTCLAIDGGNNLRVGGDTANGTRPTAIYSLSTGEQRFYPSNQVARPIQFLDSGTFTYMTMAGPSTVASTGQIRVPNATTIVGARNAGDTADLPLLATNNSNSCILGMDAAGLVGAAQTLVSCAAAGYVALQILSSTAQVRWNGTSFFRFGAQSETAAGGLNVASGDAWASAATNTSGAPLRLQGGKATSEGVTGLRGGVRIELSSSGVVMMEAAEPALNRRVTVLNRGAAITTTELPANTGDLVTFLGNAATAPTAAPVSGALLYSNAGAFSVYGPSATAPLVVGADSNSIAFPGSSASTGLVRAPANVVVLAARNAGGSNNISLLETDGADNLYVGAATAGVRPAAVVLDAVGGQVFRTNGLTQIVSNSSLTQFTPPSILWAETTVNPTLSQTTRVGDNPTRSMTVASQAPSASATGTNRNPGNLSLVVPSPIAGGAYGSLILQNGGVAITVGSNGTLPWMQYGSAPAASGFLRAPSTAGSIIAVRNVGDSADHGILILDGTGTLSIGGTASSAANRIGTIALVSSSAIQFWPNNQINRAASFSDDGNRTVLTLTGNTQSSLVGHIRLPINAIAIAARNAAASNNISLLETDGSDNLYVGAVTAGVRPANTVLDAVTSVILRVNGNNNTSITGAGIGFGVSSATTTPFGVIHTARASDASVADLHVRAQSAWVSAATFVNGANLRLTSGSAQADGTTGLRGAVRLEIGAAGVVMLEAAEVAVGRRAVVLNRTSAITATELPANTGDLVTFLGNAATAPTAAPVSGALLYANAGAFSVYGPSATAPLVVGADSNSITFPGATATAGLVRVLAVDGQTVLSTRASSVDRILFATDSGGVAYVGGLPTTATGRVANVYLASAFSMSFYPNNRTDRALILSDNGTFTRMSLTTGTGTTANTGQLNFSNAADIMAARNVANSGDVPLLSFDSANALRVGQNNASSGTSPAQVLLYATTSISLTVNSNAVVLSSTGVLSFSTAFSNPSVAFGTNTAQSGFLRASNNTTILAARNAANGADLQLLWTDTGNFLNIGGTNVAGTLTQVPFWLTAAAATPVLGQFARSTEAPTSNLQVRASDAWASAVTGANQNGGTLRLQGGAAKTDGTTGLRGGVRLELSSGGVVLAEVAEKVLGQRVTALNRGTAITTTELPANTGDLVTFVGDAATFPTAAPANGFIMAGSSGFPYFYSSSGRVQSGLSTRITRSISSDANYTAVAADYSATIMEFTSSVSLSATRDVVVPLTDGYQWVVFNNTTGGQALRFIGASGTGVTVANGTRATIYTDGTNVVRATADV